MLVFYEYLQSGFLWPARNLLSIQYTVGKHMQETSKLGTKTAIENPEQDHRQPTKSYDFTLKLQ